MIIRGMGVGRRIAVGPVIRKHPRLPEPEDKPFSGDPEREWALAAEALSSTATDLLERSERADGEAKDILQALADEADDPALAEDVEALIRNGKTAERAVFEAFRAYRELLAGLGGYQADRAADLDDLSQRTISFLRGLPPPGVPESDTPFVLVAEDLAPADTALLDLDVVLALITEQGGPTSHTAILARSKSLPAVVGAADAATLKDGTLVIVDAAAGTIEANPSPESVALAHARLDALKADSVQPPRAGALADGFNVPLLSNLGSPDEAEEALSLGAEGVGLFRTELLFLDAAEPPGRDEQREQYSQLLSAFRGKKVVARVLDAGADKPLSFLGNTSEANPALGLRGLRALRQAEGVLRDQLTALAEAERDSGAELWVMAPMVADIEDTKYFVNIAHECGIRTAGVMVEIPSAALLAHQVLEHCDFISLGTNDLTQYTLAADRQLGSVAAYQNPWHPAVLQLISMAGRAGADARKPVGVCGEAAADPLLAVVLVGLGITSLSMAPSALADVRAELSNHTLEQAKELAVVALAADSALSARQAVTSRVLNRVAD